MDQTKSKSVTARVPSQCETSPRDTQVKHTCENAFGKREGQTPDEFDVLLSRAIDKTLRYVLGDINTSVVYNYLTTKGCDPNNTPAKTDEFSKELRKLLGSGRGQMLGAASILEETIVKTLSAELKIHLDNPRPTQFADDIQKLREAYDKTHKRRF